MSDNTKQIHSDFDNDVNETLEEIPSSQEDASEEIPLLEESVVHQSPDENTDHYSLESESVESKPTETKDDDVIEMSNNDDNSDDGESFEGSSGAEKDSEFEKEDKGFGESLSSSREDDSNSAFVETTEDNIPTLEMNIDLGYSDEDFVNDEDDEPLIEDAMNEPTPEPQDENIATLEAIVFGGDDPTAPAPDHIVKPLIDGESEAEEAQSEASPEILDSSIEDSVISSSTEHNIDHSSNLLSPAEDPATDARISDGAPLSAAMATSPFIDDHLSNLESASNDLADTQKDAEPSQAHQGHTNPANEIVTPTSTPTADPTPTPSVPKQHTVKGENPFLPKHILDRLNQGKRNLVEEIAQSSAALDASTALLRTQARAEKINKSIRTTENKPVHHEAPSPKDKNELKKQKVIDDLVEDYLPLLAAELRRRLRRMLDE